MERGSTVEHHAFAGCSIGKLTLPEGLETIEEEAFSHGDLREGLVIPSSVKSIGKRAFWWNRLYDVTVPKDTILGHDAFGRQSLITMWPYQNPFNLQITGINGDKSKFSGYIEDVYYDDDSILPWRYVKDSWVKDGDLPIGLTKQDDGRYVIDRKHRLVDIGYYSGAYLNGENADEVKADFEKDHFYAGSPLWGDVTLANPYSYARSFEEYIPYTPTDINNPADIGDKNIPKYDKNNDPIELEDYHSVVFKIWEGDKGKGTISLGDYKDKEQISTLVRQGDWSWRSRPIVTAKEGYDFWHWAWGCHTNQPWPRSNS